MIVIGRETVARQLTFEVCIPLMREAMIALSQGRTRQILRSILDLGNGNALGVMPGAMDVQQSSPRQIYQSSITRSDDGLFDMRPLRRQ